MLNKQTLFKDVFAPSPDDIVLVMVDTPHDGISDHPDWMDRRQMAEDWRIEFSHYPLRTHPLYSFPATGANNGELPEWGAMDGQPVRLKEVLAQSTIVIAMTQYSATAPLSLFAQAQPNLRVASMPGVLRRMENTALAADYSVIAQRTHVLADFLTRAVGADLIFSTGDEIYFDVRHRTGHADDGLCHHGKARPLINLPSGEAFIVPYEGERPGDPSRTRGRIPVSRKGELFHLLVEANRMVEVVGDGSHAALFREMLAVDEARRNVAELGLGCNDHAVVGGVVLEDEKAGLHWAFGRSEHLGGTVGPDAFTSMDHVVHHDIVYARESPVGVRSLTLHYPDAPSQTIMRDSEYTLF